MNATTHVKYSCHRCKTVERKVKVEARTQADDVVVWVQQVVTPAVAQDHATWAPFCSSMQCDLMLPIHNDVVGGTDESN